MKLQNILSLLLAAAVLTAGVLLPDWVGAGRKQHDNGAVSYAVVGEGQLRFTDNKTMSLKSKIALLSYASSARDVPAGLAALTEKEVFRAAEDAVMEYRRLGLIDPRVTNVSRSLFSLRPVLFSDSNMKSSSLFWIASYAYEDVTMDLVLDDQTAAVLEFSYTSYKSKSGWQPDADSQEATRKRDMESLCTAYLEGLGTELSEFTPKDCVEASGFAWEGSDCRCMTYMSWDDLNYGDVTLALEVGADGFSVQTA